MKNYLPEPGCMYDTLEFFSRRLDKQPDGVQCLSFNRIKAKIGDAGISVPHYFLPFIHRHKQRCPLLHHLLFDDRPYSDCTLERALSILLLRH